MAEGKGVGWGAEIGDAGVGEMKRKTYKTQACTREAGTYARAGRAKIAAEGTGPWKKEKFNEE